MAVLADVEPEWPRESIAPPHNESRADRIKLPHEVNDIHKKPDRIHEWPLAVQPAGCDARHRKRMVRGHATRALPLSGSCAARSIPRCCHRYVRSCGRSRKRSTPVPQSRRFRRFYFRPGRCAATCRGEAIRSAHSTMKRSHSDRRWSDDPLVTDAAHLASMARRRAWRERDRILS